MKTLSRRFANEQGIVLVITLLILALLMGAGAGAIVSMQTDFKSSGNLKRGTQAFYIADAGVNHARQQLQGALNPNFDSIFSASNGTVIVPKSSFYGGSYTVTRQDSQSTPFPRIKILSVGTAANNAQAQIEAWFRKDAGRPPKAVETDKKLDIDGNSKILGICGGAQANDDLKANGNPAVQMTAGLTSSKKVDLSGNPCIGSAACAGSPQPSEYVVDTKDEKTAYEAANGNAPTYTIPSIEPADYAPKVAAMESSGNHYILNDDGFATTGGTCDTSGYCLGGTRVTLPAGWSFSGGKWKVTGSSAASGVFYSETGVDISGSPGTDASPWQATIISREKINVSGSPRVKPYGSTSEELKNHLFVAGDDLNIDGNVRADYAGGAVLVKKKFEIKGDTSINGFIIGRDNGDLKENAKITYSCDFGCSGPGCPPGTTIATVSWVQKF